ncbi:MAG: DUF3048 domain-containing protein [Clostridiaceae bacterium]|nr:DUF3048 domain-containing protein [Clostridiaceae bacterium]
MRSSTYKVIVRVVALLLAVLMGLSLIMSLVSCSSDPAETVAETTTAETTLTSTTTTGTSTTSTITPTPTTTEPPPPEIDLLFPDRYPVAFMLNNSWEARPQSGLSRGKLIYQLMTEARVTRLLMVTDAEDGVVGPVRSARPAYLDLVAQHQAFYAHAGNFKVITASPVANYIRSLDALTGFYGMYYRTTHRVSPHNLYTNMETVYSWAEGSYGNIEPDKPVEGLKAYDVFVQPEGGEIAASLAYQYNVSKELFIYDETGGVYNKYNDGYTLADEQTGQALEIANIIVIYRPHGWMPNNVHIRVDWIAQGAGATYLTGGKKYAISWDKPSHTAPITYYLDGEELILNPGLTWILVVDDQALATIAYN